MVRSLLSAALVLVSIPCTASPVATPPELRPIHIPDPGAESLSILTPDVIEITRITTKPPDPARPAVWDFVRDGRATLPAPGAFRVEVNGRRVPVEAVSFKRRPIYAPLKRRDLRIGNWLYLRLAQAIPGNSRVRVTTTAGALFDSPELAATAHANRLSPVIHVNQVGYATGHPKKAMAGYYLGNLGELDLDAIAQGGFTVIDTESGKKFFEGELKRRRDVGFTFSCYQNVWEADFSALDVPGEYRLQIDGLGVSLPFRIHPDLFGAFARAYALGLYHQRCGAANALPFTRFVHDRCHTTPAEVPDAGFNATAKFLADVSADATNSPRHTAPRLKSVDDSLYPFVRKGRVEVHGGHHDAGDYSKYTINSAGLVHHLIFAVDVLDGVAALDNLGLPESGDGISDILQEAMWEADFLARMQDADGGFYFLVYPKERRYEDDVLPDDGDPQVVWPKTTSATAAATAALAEIGSSPELRRHFPDAAARYLAAARKGWEFLRQAIEQNGRDGAYQKLTHYGHEFLHDDELAWAAAALFAATGQGEFQRELIAHFDPSSRETRRWTWWRLFEGYGNAIRTYAFAASSGRLREDQLDPVFLAKCRSELLVAAKDHLRFANESAYGTSFPDPTKRFRTAGWYFSLDRAFDMAVALSLDSTPEREQAPLLDAILTNLNFEAGANPVNISYITGLGWNRPRDIVHQYAQNDRRVLPPSGLPIGNLQAGFQFLHHYQRELGQLTFPSDGAQEDPYPIYDRWGDSFNTATEFVVVNQARALAVAAWLMARTPAAKQSWQPAPARIVPVRSNSQNGAPSEYTVTLPGAELGNARVLWESADREPAFGKTFRPAETPLRPDLSKPPGRAPRWIEVEVTLPDGRRFFGVAE